MVKMSIYMNEGWNVAMQLRLNQQAFVKPWAIPFLGLMRINSTGFILAWKVRNHCWIRRMCWLFLVPHWELEMTKNFFGQLKTPRVSPWIIYYIAMMYILHFSHGSLVLHSRVIPLWWNWHRSFQVDTFSNSFSYTPAKWMFFRGGGVVILESVRQCVHVSVCIQNTTFCQSFGRGVKSLSETALVQYISC